MSGTMVPRPQAKFGKTRRDPARSNSVLLEHLYGFNWPCMYAQYLVK
jgi:hypothetical protein